MTRPTPPRSTTSKYMLAQKEIPSHSAAGGGQNALAGRCGGRHGHSASVGPPKTRRQRKARSGSPSFGAQCAAWTARSSSPCRPHSSSKEARRFAQAGRHPHMKRMRAARRDGQHVLRSPSPARRRRRSSSPRPWTSGTMRSRGRGIDAAVVGDAPSLAAGGCRAQFMSRMTRSATPWRSRGAKGTSPARTSQASGRPGDRRPRAAGLRQGKSPSCRTKPGFRETPASGALRQSDARWVS
mmetsp:Transcript_112873/g.324389  ORF Transcript_112873/g.324389 Transcript_112873/m.324389 type:complete len:240 (-) Transcript_112873:429-1148(-)